MDANNKVQYVIELLQQGDTVKARQELEAVSKSADSAGKSFEKLRAGAEQLIAVFGAEFTLRESLNAFVEAEKVSSKLTSALSSTKQETAAMRQEIGSLTDELKEMTTFSGTEITNVIAKLVALGATKDSIRPLTNAVLDLSTLMDKDLNRATQAMGRALRGEFSSFTELGFHLNDLHSTGQKLNSVLLQIGQTAGGQAKAGASSLGGEIEKMNKQLQEFKENLGKGVAETTSFIGGIFQKMGEHSVPELQKATEVLAGVHDRLRASLERELAAMEKMEKLAGTDLTGTGGATVGPPVSQFLRSQLQAGFANGNVDEQQKALDAVRRQLGTGSTAATPPAAPAVDVRNLEEEKTALEHLSTLRVEMAKATLTQFNQERIAAEINYTDRALQIEKLANQGRLTAAERAQADAENSTARMAELERVAEHERELSDRNSLKEQETLVKMVNLEASLSNQKVAAQLRGEDLVKFEMAARHDERVRAINQEHFDDVDQFNDAMRMESELFAAEQDRYQKEHSFNEGLKIDLIQVGKTAQEAFSQQLAGALVDAFSQGDKAFQKFAANFLKAIAQMILQTLILRAIQSIFLGGGGQVGSPGSSQVSAGAAKLSAAGGFYPILAASGIQTVDQATFLPQFNVIAGEAGRELLTVFANPRSGSLGGVPAQFGDVGPNRMALINMSMNPRRMASGGSSSGMASAPAGSGATPSMGGAMVEVSLSAGLEAKIIKQAVDASVVQVTKQLGRDGPLSAAARKLNA